MPLGFLKRFEQALNYIRSGYYSAINPAVKSILIEKDVQFIGIQCVVINGGGVIKKGTRIEAWTSYAGDRFSPSIIIGRNVHIGVNCHITAINKIQIGNDVLFGSNVLVSDNNHGNSRNDLGQSPINRKLSTKGPVIIGDKVWLGDNVVILSGVTIGNNSIIGANSVVAKDVPPYSIAVGSPAKVIRIISQT